MRWVLGLLLVVHAACALHVAVTSDWSQPDFVTGDALRYREITSAPGLPYRDHEVEYPPLTWTFLALVDVPPSADGAGKLLVLTQLVADVAVAAALLYGWSAGAAVAWLVLLLPFVWRGWIFGRVDLLSVALAIGGLALAGRRRETRGGFLLGLGVLAKAWPIVTYPALAIEGRTRALRAALLTALVGGIAWLVVGGFDGLQQVLSFRDAKGWQVESLVGSVLLLDVDRPGFSDANALRIGSLGTGGRLAMGLLLAAALVGGWLLARRAARRRPDRVEDVAVLGSLVAVGALLLLSPLLSPQFLVWLLPFVAMRWRDGWLVGLMGVAMLLSEWTVDRYGELLEEGRRWLSRVVVARNVVLVAVVVLAAWRLVALARTSLSAPDGACRARRIRR
jgi:hypothetical protein